MTQLTISLEINGNIVVNVNYSRRENKFVMSDP